MVKNNVTPIQHSPRRAREKIGLKLSESEEGAEFSTLDVVNALHGVCVALDECVVSGAGGIYNANHACHLVMAAKVLSSIVQERLITV